MKVRYLGNEDLFTFNALPSGRRYRFDHNNPVDLFEEDLNAFVGGNFEVIGLKNSEADDKPKKRRRKKKSEVDDGVY